MVSQIDGERSIAARQAEARRRNLARKRAQALATKSLVARVGSPPPVPGRKHEPVQTEVYLEEVGILRYFLSFFLLSKDNYVTAVRETGRGRDWYANGLFLGQTADAEILPAKNWRRCLHPNRAR